MSNINCPYCKRDADFNSHTNIIFEYNCSVCGQYFIYNSGSICGENNNNIVSSYLFYNKN